MSADEPNPWSVTEEHLPDNPDDLITEITAYAAARRRDARTHHNCDCYGCKVREDERIRNSIRHRAA